MSATLLLVPTDLSRLSQVSFHNSQWNATQFFRIIPEEFHYLIRLTFAAPIIIDNT
jgi:hypothetical protein